jgi:hypothetical protein
MKITKRVRVLAAVVGSGIVVASSACSVDTGTPTTAPFASTQQLAPSFARGSGGTSTGGAATSGAVANSLNVTFDPSVDQHIALGPNRIDIPANAVCEVGKSGYGPTYWNLPCTPETKSVTLTITVTGAGTDTASVDFQPAMRFNPARVVTLNFFVSSLTKAATRNWDILYCSSTTSGTSGKGSGGSGTGGGKKCVNEALTDHDLSTHADYANSSLFRRIKHFSVYQVQDAGYLVTE